jgi:MMPL family
MTCIRIQKPRVRGGRPWLEVLPLDPREQTLSGPRLWPSAATTTWAAARGGNVSHDTGQPYARCFRTGHPPTSAPEPRPTRAGGILLDATVVRALLAPALVSLFGRWNWWLPASCGSHPVRRQPRATMTTLWTTPRPTDQAGAAERADQVERLPVA